MKMEKIKAIIVDTREFATEITSKLIGNNKVEVVGSTDNGKEAIALASETNPNLVILDIVSKESDGFEIIEKIKSFNPQTKFIVITSINSNTVLQKIMNFNVDYYMVKPVDINLVIKRICELSFDEPKIIKVEKISKQLEEKITNIFITVGIPAHIKGYYFLREAIKMAVSEPNIINSITKKLYPSIANIYETSSSKVERAIRHAIEVAWNKGKIENINDVFGLRVYDSHEKPTNGEFIALVADKMLLENLS